MSALTTLQGVSVINAVGAVIALAAVILGTWRACIPIVRLVRKIHDFVEDWNGCPERKDDSGAVIEPGKPGVPALLETVRAQVQNSHSTNMRDDLDEVSRKLDEHIEVAKDSDRRLEELAEQISLLVKHNEENQ